MTHFVRVSDILKVKQYICAEKTCGQWHCNLVSQGFMFRSLLHSAGVKTLVAAGYMSPGSCVVNFHLFIAEILVKVFVAAIFDYSHLKFSDKY